MARFSLRAAILASYSDSMRSMSCIISERCFRTFIWCSRISSSHSCWRVAMSRRCSSRLLTELRLFRHSLQQYLFRSSRWYSSSCRRLGRDSSDALASNSSEVLQPAVLPRESLVSRELLELKVSSESRSRPTRPSLSSTAEKAPSFSASEFDLEDRAPTFDFDRLL